MTEHPYDRNDKKLEALYREAGDVEPDAGLDRIIRARAEQAARTGRSRSRAPWLGGLVTASVAIVAIAVVMQQMPPDAPESPAPQHSAEPEAFESKSLMAPSVGADAALESSTETRQARDEMREVQSAGDAARAVPPPSAAPLNGPTESRSGQRRAERLGDIVAEQAAEVAEPARPASDAIDDANGEGPDTMLARIEALIADGEIQRARAALEAFTREYPDHPVPEKIEKALVPPQ